MDPLLVGLLAAVVVIATTALAPRAGVAAPLILVVVGVGISALPGVPPIEVPPELILAGVLPPLLYSTAVSLPTMDFRRDLATIGGLSVVLVVMTSVLLGLVYSWILPDLGLAGGIALGAILSPTDAVATSVTRRAGAPPRVITVLEGEGLLNDASALVVLRSAVAATAVTVSFGEVVGDFAWAVAGAVVCGLVVGVVGLRLRGLVGSAALSTAISFVAPFAAYLPAEHLEASGLVAVVTAGLVTGHGSAKHLGARDRFFEYSNWRTVELLLEGGVFLLLGLELPAIVEDVHAADGSLWLALGLAALGAGGVLLVRTAYVWPLLIWLSRKAECAAERREDLAAASERLGSRIADAEPDGVLDFGQDRLRRGPQGVPVRRVRRLQTSLVRRVADIDYLVAKPLGPREGGLLVWAGMRGVVTVAAAQSLPHDFPRRSFVVLVAYGVALGTLLGQGGTLPAVVRRLGLTGHGRAPREEVLEVRRIVEGAARELLDADVVTHRDGKPYHPDVVQRVRFDVVREEAEDDADAVRSQEWLHEYRRLRLRVVRAQRTALLAARSTGIYDSALLESELTSLDAEQITLELKKGA